MELAPTLQCTTDMSQAGDYLDSVIRALGPVWSNSVCVFTCLQGHLVPSDEITVYYSCEPAGDYLDHVIQAHTDFILATTKAPLKTYPVPKDSGVIVQEKTQVGWVDIKHHIVRQNVKCFQSLRVGWVKANKQQYILM